MAQQAQLSQRDRATAAGSLLVKYNRKTISCRHFRSIFNHCNVLGLQATEFGEITQNKGYYAVEGILRSPMSVSKARMRLTNWHLIHLVQNYTASKLSQIIVKMLDENWLLFVSEPPSES